MTGSAGMSEPQTEAGQRMLATLQGHPTWLRDVAPATILAIEEQAAAEARRELVAKVEGLYGWTKRSADSLDRAAVIALLDPSR